MPKTYSALIKRNSFPGNIKLLSSLIKYVACEEDLFINMLMDQLIFINVHVKQHDLLKRQSDLSS